MDAGKFVEVLLFLMRWLQRSLCASRFIVRNDSPCLDTWRIEWGWQMNGGKDQTESERVWSFELEKWTYSTRWMKRNKTEHMRNAHTLRMRREETYGANKVGLIIVKDIDRERRKRRVNSGDEDDKFIFPCNSSWLSVFLSCNVRAGHLYRVGLKK